MKIDLVIPVLNEEGTLKQQILDVLAYLDQDKFNDYFIQLIIADNGSSDATQSIAEQLIIENPKNLKYLRLSKRGVGIALKEAWKKSEADIVGYMDLDLATDIDHLSEVFSCFLKSDIDIVYGSRLSKSSKVIGRTLKREITSRVFNLILRLYLNNHIVDGMCGFKFVRRNKLDKIMENGANSDGWFFCTELLVVGEYLGLNLSVLPVKWTDDPNSKVKIMKLTLEYLRAMKSLKNQLLRGSS